MTRDEVIEALARGGFVAPEEEAEELLAAPGDLSSMLARRLTGEPLAWITGSTAFCGLTVRVHPGVYVPRWQTEMLAGRAAALRPRTAIDLCTGCGAVAAVLMRAGAQVWASDISTAAVACARANGVDAYVGDLFEPLPAGPVDLVCGVVPYVPSDELRLLHRDTLTFEAPGAYDGGPHGTALLQRAVDGARDRLRPGGALLLELGGDQAAALDLSGYTGVEVVRDEDGDVRGVVGSRA